MVGVVVKTKLRMQITPRKLSVHIPKRLYLHCQIIKQWRRRLCVVDIIIHLRISQRLLQILWTNLTEGEDSMGKYIQINHARIYLNYPTLLEKHIDTELIPDNAVVYGKPESFVQKHIVSIIAIIGICLILFILLAAYAWSQRKLKFWTNKTKIELEKLNHVLQVVLEASDAFPWAIDIINNELSAFGKNLNWKNWREWSIPMIFIS